MAHKHLFRLIMGLVFLFTINCDKEKWIELELTSDQCTNKGMIMGQFNDEVGSIEVDNTNSLVYIELPPSEVLVNGAKLFPCNLNPIDLMEYTSIKFSGLVYALASESDSIYQLPSGYAQTLLSKAQVSSE